MITGNNYTNIKSRKQNQFEYLNETYLIVFCMLWLLPGFLSEWLIVARHDTL
jgi:hypothetical protein